MTASTPPTVSDAMREAIDAHLKAQCERWGIRLGSGSRTQLAIDLCTGPIASALAALERENATLRASAERMEAALDAALDGADYLADRYRALWEGKTVRDLAEAEASYNAASKTLGRLRLARAALTPKETPDA